MIFRSMRVITVALAVLGPLGAGAQLKAVGDGGPGPAKAMHLSVELIASGKQLTPGGHLQTGLHFVMEDGWHVYWRNAGFAGGPPSVAWTLPEGISAGPLLFPVPSRLPLGPLADFGYEHEVTYPIELAAVGSAKAGPVHLDAKVDWLVCSASTCIPGKAHMGLDLTVAPGAGTAVPAAPIAAALARMPQSLPAGATVTANVGNRDVVLTVKGIPAATHAEFYPYDADVLCYAADQVSAPVDGGLQIWDRRATEQLGGCDDPNGKVTPAPKSVHGLIKVSDTTSYEFTSPLTAAADIPRAANATGQTIVKVVQEPHVANGNELTAASAIGLAFLGGILLNLMPCVFPVLFLKALALVNSSNEERGRLRRHGLVYALGILVSFWSVVALLLVLRASGSKLGWGYQLQSPGFVVVLAAAIFFFALSLAGQFDLGLSLTSAGGELAKKQGYAGSFFTGVLATVVATPCTAPLMGAAVGFALVQPIGLTFVIFTALALGLALPYVLLSAQPSWVRLLPKPGAWMEVLKQFTSLILFGAAIWLTLVYGTLAGDEVISHIAYLLACFLLLAVAGWVLGRWPAQTKSTLAAVLIGAVAIAIPLWPQKVSTVTWQPYSEQALADARAAGKPVFIDFTAAWCLSCQVNERLVLKSSDVEKALTNGNVVLMKADWTKYDEKITEELGSVGRSGVPTYVLYPVKGDADVLPELLTKQIVLDAIRRDGTK